MDRADGPREGLVQLTDSRVTHLVQQKVKFKSALVILPPPPAAFQFMQQMHVVPCMRDRCRNETPPATLIPQQGP